MTSVRKISAIVLGIVAIGLVLFFIAGPGILLIAIAGSAFDRTLKPGIEIVNDTDAPVSFITQTDGYGRYADTSCWSDLPWCPTSTVMPGDRIVHSHGNGHGERVLVLVPMAQKDYWEETGEHYKGTNSPTHRVRDDIPENAIRIQESEFLCYEMDMSEAKRRWGELLWRKQIYSFQWSDVLEHDECPGARR